jgi:hypothetical protein
MLYNPAEEKKGSKKDQQLQNFVKKSKLYERWLRLKKRVLLKTQKPAKEVREKVYQ